MGISVGRDFGIDTIVYNKHNDLMKKIIVITIAVLGTMSCKNLKVTGNPSNHTSTSGTLGSAKYTNQLPAVTDTTRRLDTLKIVRDTLPR